MRIILSCLLIVLLSGCGGIDLPFIKKRPAMRITDAPLVEGGLIRPRARPDGLIGGVGETPPDGARTVEDFDTTTSAEREAAISQESGGRKLGTTIASLGSPTEPGFWLKTPLVKREQQGHVIYPATGKLVQVTLIPIDGPASAGSRMSLAALRLIGAPLTGLPEIDVFGG